ncbi:hypothetical protein A0H81_02753 [Grifola frondosa]|uniref:Uncharacterized protein n=1 Tax=Grifola frondosa TaxID=5627 RepID=A0A1C7MMM0_GRIFR|nr:hypothetical protein A0H81_02753 [Grifola frondosa]
MPQHALFTASLQDIVAEDEPQPKVDYEQLKLGVREARAWLRGRYPSLSTHVVDSILRMFCPDLGPTDILTAGQFFAVLRLVSHVQDGRQLDKSLVFVQAHPAPSRPPTPTGKPSRSLSESHAAQPTPSPSLPSPDANPFQAFTSRAPESAPAAPYIPAAPYVPAAPSASTTPRPSVPPVLPPKPNNPFLARRGSQGALPQSAPANAPGFSHQRTRPSASLDAKLPPLPPRKPPVLPPPRHASLNPSAGAALPSRSSTTNHPNVLIQQSLQATRIAQSLKKAEQQLENERVLEQSLRTPPHPQHESLRRRRRLRFIEVRQLRGRPMPDRVPSLPPRRRISPSAPSTVGSTRSFEQVAHAKVAPFKRPTLPLEIQPPWLASRSTSPVRTPPRSLVDLPSEPPPTHPDRKPPPTPESERAGSPSSRMLRSQSMHHASAPPLPPPPRRKRPESVQLTPTTPPSDSPFASPAPQLATANHTLSRHLSISSRGRDRGRDRDRDRDASAFSDSPIANIQKTLTSLQLRAQPHLDAARYKAEAGLTRRGFVQHSQHGARWIREEGEEGLMDDVDAGGGTSGRDDDDGLDQDPDAGEGCQAEKSVAERVRRLREGGVDVAMVDKDGDRPGAHRLVLERDDLKWPAGEGWKPL